jgi:hypothetical protein
MDRGKIASQPARQVDVGHRSAVSPHGFRQLSERTTARATSSTTIIRVQLFDPSDEADVEATREILRSVKVESGAMQEKPKVDWDWEAMLDLRARYEAEYRKMRQVPSDWQGKRGEVDRYKGHNIAVTSAWGLFPDTEAVYINQFPDKEAVGCFSAAYAVPDNDAFWSITVYNGEDYMFSDNNNINSAAATYNEDGTVTVHYGSREDCGEHPNRLDITDGRNLLMRVYRPGASVRNGGYVMPEITQV